MKAAFLILSAINQQATTDTSIQQLQERLSYLSERFHDAPNAVIEYSEESLSEQQKERILPVADLLAEFRPNELLRQLKSKLLAENSYDAQQYQDLLQTIALNWFLQNAHGNQLFDDIDCVVVMDADTELDENFLRLATEENNNTPRFFFKKAQLQQAQMAYPTDTWAFKPELTDELIDYVIDASEVAYQRLNDASDSNAPYSLGQALFKAIDTAKIHFLV